MKRSRIYILLLTLLVQVTSAATIPSVFVQSYPADEYNASCQNWDLAVSDKGILYVANDEGLLTFDGNTWNKYYLPDYSPILKVAFRKDTVFSQGESSQGFWIENSVGDMVYQPLEQIPPHINIDKTPKKYLVSTEIQKHIPSAFATAGNLHITGTEANGLFFTNEKADILLHLSLQNLLPDNIVRAISVQDTNLLWVALDNGICQININPPIYQLAKRSELGKLEDAFLRKNELFVRTNTGYFKRQLYSTDAFQPIQEEETIYFLQKKPETTPSLHKLLPKTESLETFIEADNIYSSSNNLYWLTKGNEAAFIQRKQDDCILKCRVMFTNYNINLVTRGKQFFPLNDSLYVISATQGAYLINTNRLIRESSGNFTPPRFSRLVYTDKKGKHKLLPTTERLTLPYRFQELFVYVGTTIFTPNHQISYFIEGVSSEWSDWQKDGRISFLQLPEGKYPIRIRKYVTKGAFPESNLYIEVRPPWYNSLWAYIVYLLLLWVIIKQSLNYHLRKQRLHEEEKLKAQQLQKAQQMQQMQNEMLEAELHNKNNELSLQTSALIKRNQVIRDLINELERQKEVLGERYPKKMYNKLHALMEEAMSDQADWLLFENYFNSAHQNFTERLRQQYEELTPGDLRVCCLLRMNLTSKEIASLLNVTVRAVELRRYRLRKRLSLAGDTNLVDFLMNFSG